MCLNLIEQEVMEGMQFDILPLRGTDFETVSSSLERLIPNEIYRLTIYSASGYSSFLRALYSLPHTFRDTYMFGAYSKNELLGFSEWKQVGTSFFLNSLFIMPEYQSCGVGSQLLAHGLSVAKQMQYTSVELDVFESNTHAYSWYRTKGFERTASKHWLTGKNAYVDEGIPRNVSIIDYPLAEAAQSQYGFSRFLCKIGERGYSVGRIRDELFRLQLSETESHGQLLAALAGLDERRSLLLISDQETVPGFAYTCSSIRMKRTMM